LLGEALLPAPDSCPADPTLTRDILDVQPFGGCQDDLGTLGVFLGGIVIADDPLKLLAVVVDQLNANRLGHGPRFAFSDTSVSPMSRSVHKGQQPPRLSSILGLLGDLSQVIRP
jgi:hypothetical protein